MEKKVIKESVENTLVGTIIGFAKENGLTLSNVRDVMYKVEERFYDSATLDKEGSREVTRVFNFHGAGKSSEEVIKETRNIMRMLYSGSDLNKR